jgi:hypothetical protein
MKYLSHKILSSALGLGLLFTLGVGAADAHPRNYQHHHGHQSWYRYDDRRVYHDRDRYRYSENRARNDYYYRDRRYRGYDDDTSVRLDLNNGDDRYYDRDADLEIGPFDINF